MAMAAGGGRGQRRWGSSEGELMGEKGEGGARTPFPRSPWADAARGGGAARTSEGAAVASVEAAALGGQGGGGRWLGI